MIECSLDCEKRRLKTNLFTCFKDFSQHKRLLFDRCLTGNGERKGGRHAAEVPKVREKNPGCRDSTHGALTLYLCHVIPLSLLI